MNQEFESPEHVRISTAAALTLKYFGGRFYRNARLNALNLLLTYGDGCRANCAYCGLSKSRIGDTFIRVDWPVVEVDDVIDRTKRYGRHLQRVCVSMITHSRALNDMCEVMQKFSERTNLLISGLISPTMIRSKEKVRLIKEVGAHKVGVAVDAATPKLFEELRGRGVRGPHSWEHYWQVAKWSVNIFGTHNVGVHLIVGLGETEKEMVDTIQRAYDIGAKTHLFSFYPEAGSSMQDWGQPSYGHYRRIQLARYIINEGLGTAADMRFNDKGQVVDFGIDTTQIIEDGRAFMTSGCEGKDGKVACNRPFGNERPSNPIRNFPFMPTKKDIEEIKAQLWQY
jgi:biotin synthase